MYVLGVAAWLLIANNFTFVNMRLVVTAGGFVLVVVLNGEVLTVLLGFIYYILLMPTYVNVFFTYLYAIFTIAPGK